MIINVKAESGHGMKAGDIVPIVNETTGEEGTFRVISTDGLTAALEEVIVQ